MHLHLPLRMLIVKKMSVLKTIEKLIKPKLFASLGMSSVLVIFSSLAFSAENLKVGIVDIQSAIDASRHVKEINKKLEKEFGPTQTDLNALQNEIRSMEERFMKDSAIMSEDEARRLQQQVGEKKSRLKFEHNELQRKVQARQQELSMPLMKLVEEVVAEIQSEGGYDLILHKQMALHFNEKYDLTQQITEKLNKK